MSGEWGVTGMCSTGRVLRGLGRGLGRGDGRGDGRGLEDGESSLTFLLFEGISMYLNLFFG